MPGRSRQHRALWARVLGWVAAGLGALILLLVAAGYVLLHTSSFRAFVVRKAEAKASQALGSQVQFRDFSLSWAAGGPGLNLYNVVVYGAPPYPTPPLVQISRLHVQVTISSILHFTWYVDDVGIEHPVVHIFADSQGRTNLPHSSSSKSGSQSKVNIFSLGIRHLWLDQGEVYYNNQKGNLAANLLELRVKVGFQPSQEQYSGTLSYREGKLQWNHANPIPHNLDVTFSATPSQFRVENAVLNSDGSRLSLQATASDYSQPRVHLSYTAEIDTKEFRRALNDKSLPAGIIHLSGVLNYKNEPGRPFLATTALQGKLHSAGLAVHQNAVSLAIREIGANYSLNNGDARITELHAQLLGGSLSGTATMRNLTGATRSSATASLTKVSISDLEALNRSAAKERGLVQGSLNVQATANWGKTLDDLVAQADVRIAAMTRTAAEGGNIPVNGIIHAEYNASRNRLAFQPSYIKTPQSTLSLHGTVSNNSALEIQLRTNQLHELEELANDFRRSGSAPFNLRGNVNLQTTVTGAVRNPQIRGQLTANNLQVRGTSWKLLHTQFAASSSAVQLENGELLPAEKGRVTFQGSADLQHWTFTDSSSFQTQFGASDLNVARLAKAAGVTKQVSGTLSAKVEAHGTRVAPVGQGSIQLAHASIGNQPVNSVDVKFQGNGTAVTAQAQVTLAAGTIDANGQYQPKQQSYTATVRTTGFHLGQLEMVKEKNLQLEGVLNADLSGQGTIHNPALQATIEVPQLSIRNQKINNLRLTASVANRAAKFDVSSEVLGTHVGGHGTVQLTDGYSADIAFDTQALPLQPIFAIYAPAEADNLTGQTEIHATLHGPLKEKSRLDGHLVIPQLTVNYKNAIHLAAAAPIRADYTNGTLDVKRSVIRGTGTDLTFQAQVPAAREAPISVLLQGKVDLQLAQLLNPDLTGGGQLQFDINSYGQRSNPNLEGQVRVVNASFAEVGVPVGLRNGNGVLALTRDRLNITQFKGEVGGGTVTASGGVLYRPSLQFNLAMKATGVRVLYADSIRTTLNSNLAFTGQYENSSLQGQVSVEDLAFTPGFDLMSVAGQFGGAAAPPPPTGGFTGGLRLEIAIQTPGGINASSRDLSLGGTASLRVQGTAAQPVITGRINLSDGELIFSGNRYLVQRGTIDFRNVSRTEAVVNVAVSTTIDQYNIQMHFWGPTDHLHTNYSSDPSLSPADIINLVAFGKTSEASAANPTPGSLGAESLIASQVSGQVTGRIEKLAGISQLSIDPVLGSSQQTPGARIAVQQHVTSKLFITFATDLTSTQQEAIKVEYQLNRKAAVNVVRDQNGGFSFETTFRKRW